MESVDRKVLFIDNFDSFTYNLVDDFAKRQCQTKVYRADTSIEDLKAVAAEFDPDLLVISPGPGNPDTAGVSLDGRGLLQGQAAHLRRVPGTPDDRAVLRRAGSATPRSPCTASPRGSATTSKGLFQGVENPLQAGRYHSLTAQHTAGLPGEDRRVRGHRHGRRAQDSCPSSACSSTPRAS